MAIQTFTWCARVNASADVSFRVRKAQFGDGYTQVSGDGINNRGQSWSVEFVDRETNIKAIMDFLDSHAGIKSFYWVPPLANKGLFRCESYKPTALGGGVYSISATFIQSFAP